MCVANRGVLIDFQTNEEMGIRFLCIESAPLSAVDWVE